MSLIIVVQIISTSSYCHSVPMSHGSPSKIKQGTNYTSHTYTFIPFRVSNKILSILIFVSFFQLLISLLVRLTQLLQLQILNRYIYMYLLNVHIVVSNVVTSANQAMSSSSGLGVRRSWNQGQYYLTRALVVFSFIAHGWWMRNNIGWRLRDNIGWWLKNNIS